MTRLHHVLAAGLILIVGAVLSLSLRKNEHRAAAALTAQALAAALVLRAVMPTLLGGAALEGTLPWSFPVEIIRVRLDALSAFFLTWSLPMTLLGTLYGAGYLRTSLRAGRNGGPHFALLNMISLSFIIIYSVQNALVFLLGWEVAAVSAWLLVIWEYRSQKIRFAGFNYLVSTHIGLFVLVAAFMLMHSQTGSMDFDAFGTFLSKPSRLRSIAFILLGVSCALKSAFFPFHTWLPRAHSAAPAHVSALMSGVIHKAGLFGFLRFTILMVRPEEWMGWCVLVFGCLSAIFGVLSTAVQRDLKRLLGYSSTENVGIAAIGFGVGYLGLAWDKPALVLAGFGGGIFHIFNHALFKCLLFYAAGAVYRATHIIDMERLGGLARAMPRTATMFLVGGLAISALPPLNGFMSEFLIYSGLLSGAPTPVATIALVSAAALLAFVGAVSALSMTRAFGVAFLGTPRDASIHCDGDPPWTMTIPMALHAAGVILFGIFPLFGLALVHSTLALFPAHATAFDDSALVKALLPVQLATRLLAFLLIGFSAIGWLAGRGARRHATWACGYTAVNPRMQVTGSSFSAGFASIFEAVLPQLRRGRLPRAIFPTDHGQLSTHHVDAVERRMFEVIGKGEKVVTKTAERIPEQPRVAFAMALAAIVAIAAVLMSGAAR